VVTGDQLGDYGAVKGVTLPPTGIERSCAAGKKFF